MKSKIPLLGTYIYAIFGISKIKPKACNELTTTYFFEDSEKEQMAGKIKLLRIERSCQPFYILYIK